MSGPLLRVAVLGPLEVGAATGPVDVRGVRLRGLLARLALDAGSYVSGGELVAALWGDELPVDEANALQSLVSRLRRALPDAGLLESRPGGYRLVVDADDVDASRFERAAREGGRLLTSGDPVAAAALLRDALATWRGPALADLLDLPFAAAPAARLEELRLSATEDRIAADLAVARAAARVPDVVAELDGLTAAHPLRERLWQLRVSALRDAGRVPEALATYEQARRTLAEQLGVDPGPELRELHLSLLRGTSTVAPPQVAAQRPRSATPLTSFVGRTTELERVATLLAAHRLVTLVGPGGAGKTRLALHAGQEAAERFGPNVWTVELAPVNDPADIDAALLAALTLRETNILDRLRDASGRDPLDRVCEALADRRALLVLDNCEHLVDAVAKVAEQLLTRCPDLHVLATSREPLAVYGEALCPVPPLGLPDVGSSPEEALAHPAVRLFADRAAAVVPGFAVDESTVGAVVQVCRRLDGLPLAIELAAARLRALPLAEVERRLDDRFRLLTGGSRTAVPRHRTLRAVVEWSWDLLDDEERRLAERFCVLAAGGTPDSVLAVCTDGDTDVRDLLTALVDKSLLQVGDGVDPRYRMLETLREYGAERLSARGEIHDARVAHARYFRELAETAEPRLRTADQLEWIRRLSDERDNLLAALRFAADDGDADTAVRIGAAMGWFWFMQGSNVEAATWLRIAIDVPGEGPPVQTAACLAMYAVTVWALGMGDPDRDGDLRQRVRDAGEQARGHESDYPALAVLQPVLRMIDDDSVGALAAVADSLGTPDPWTRATLLMMRAMLRENTGDAEGMLVDATDALDRYRLLGDRWGMATTTAALAMGRMNEGEVDGAIEMFQESRRWLRELSATSDEAETVLRMAGAFGRSGRLDEAEALLGEAEALVVGLGSPQLTLMCDVTRGELARARGEPDRARAVLAAAAERMGALPAGPPHLRAVALVALGHAELDVGDVAAVAALVPECVRLGRLTRDMPIVASVAVLLARLTASYDEDEQAAALLGVSRGLRGTDDLTHEDLRAVTATLTGRLGSAGFRDAYDRGAALDRDAALALLDAAAGQALRR